MGKTVTVTCDGCALDITTTSKAAEYRLALGVESKAGHGAGYYTDLNILPPIDRTHYFCGLECMDQWTRRRWLRQKLWSEFMDEWKNEHGTKTSMGFSYPEIPTELREKKQREFDTAALAVFPMLPLRRGGHRERRK